MIMWSAAIFICGKLEKLECLHSKDNPLRPMITQTIDS